MGENLDLNAFLFSMGCSRERIVHPKRRVIFTLNYPVVVVFLFVFYFEEITHIACNHGNWFSCEHAHLFKVQRQYREE